MVNVCVVRIPTCVSFYCFCDGHGGVCKGVDSCTSWVMVGKCIWNVTSLNWLSPWFENILGVFSTGQLTRKNCIHECTWLHAYFNRIGKNYHSILELLKISIVYSYWIVGKNLNTFNWTMSNYFEVVHPLIYGKAHGSCYSQQLWILFQV